MIGYAMSNIQNELLLGARQNMNHLKCFDEFRLWALLLLISQGIEFLKRQENLKNHTPTKIIPNGFIKSLVKIRYPNRPWCVLKLFTIFAYLNCSILSFLSSPWQFRIRTKSDSCLRFVGCVRFFLDDKMPIKVLRKNEQLTTSRVGGSKCSPVYVFVANIFDSLLTADGTSIILMDCCSLVMS